MKVRNKDCTNVSLEKIFIKINKFIILYVVGSFDFCYIFLFDYIYILLHFSYFCYIMALWHSENSGAIIKHA